MSSERQVGRVPSPGRPCTPVPGDLLVASVASKHKVLDQHFDDSVVLLLQADDEGAVGVVLNRPLVEAGLREELAGWGPQLSVPQVVFQGGPVEPTAAVCLASLPMGLEAPLGYTRLFGSIGALELDTPMPLVQDVYADLRVFAGYAGWQAGQLEDEVEQGLWHLVPAVADDIFSREPEQLWRSVLRRCFDQTAFFATWTSEPQLN